ncbi:MAG: EamA family transporter [Solirubrobacteraceae bacterium]
MIERSPRLGYLLTAVAASLFAISASMARVLLDDGVSALHLTEMRSVLALVMLVGYLAVTNRKLLRVERVDVRRLAFLGIFGLAAVQVTYFAAIARLDIGVALTIQYLGPGLILLWLRARHGRHLAPSLYGAVALSVLGSFLVVEAYNGLDGLDGIGLLFGIATAITFAINLVASERAGVRLDARTTLAWGFGFSTLVFLIVRPPWTFPFAIFDDAEHILLGLGVGVLGTLVPFVLIVSALRHISAARAGVVATLEPVVASVVAWPVHDQVLAAPQIAGILVVVAAVAWVQSHRPQLEAEAAPVH